MAKSGVMPKLLRWLGLAFLVIVLDQITKAVIVNHFAFGESIRVTSFFDLVLAHNTGAAFSFLAGAGGWQRWFFTIIALVAVIVIVYFLRKHGDEPRLCFALSLILGGAIGNLIDRVVLGHVIDFLLFHYAGYAWPAFNVADSAITVGAVLLAWESLRAKPQAALPRQGR
jgi:signal peptidase II